MDNSPAQLLPTIDFLLNGPLPPPRERAGSRACDNQERPGHAERIKVFRRDETRREPLHNPHAGDREQR